MHKFRHRSTRLCVETYVFTKLSEITQLTAIKSFKVADFATNRKLIYDFLLVINTNLLLSCTVSKLWLIIRQIFASERVVPNFVAIAWGDPLPISP